ncbi:MAG TPA: CPBP family glutamic-type intramembrane protease [Kofleriaceae bacterium]|nr:CPBP family glutamic-type intramembrane protease [Kofleriaceae bacterium]
MNRVRASSTASGSGDVVASLVLIFPLLLAYEIGVLFAGSVNGADIVTRALYGAAGTRAAYLLIHAVCALAFLVWIRRDRRWSTLTLEVAAPVILEAAIYALTLGALGTLIVERLLGLGLSAGSVVSAIGAGVHEELVFRLGALSLLMAMLSRTLDRRLAFLFALAISTVLFAAAHHVGAYGEPFTAHAFAFRCVAGAAFALVFWFRSLAHAVYAHVLYDVLVAAT